MQNINFSSFGFAFIIFNIISTKIISYIDYVISSLYRVLVTQFTIDNGADDTNGELIENLIKYISANRVKVQTPCYQILNDKTDIDKINDIPGKRKELDSGFYIFTYNKSIMFASIEINKELIQRLSILSSNQDSKQKTLRLSTFRWNSDNLQKLITKCNKGDRKKNNQLFGLNIFSLNNGTEKIQEKGKNDKTIYLKILDSAEYMSISSSWIDFAEIEKRSMDTIIIPDSVKNKILVDYENFIREDTKKIFQNNSIHYKRSYLLYGKPGGGKTSFIRAFASKYNMDIYELNNISLSNINVLRIKLNQIPKRSIIILEDIDVLFPSREQMAKKINLLTNESEKTRKMEEIKNIEANMSKFFNLFDGIINTMNDCVIFFTTNHLEKLDPAMLRPGRCDLKVEFPSLTKDIAQEIFTLFFPLSDISLDGSYFEEKKIMPCELVEFLKHNIHKDDKEVEKLIPEYFDNLQKITEKINSYKKSN